MKKTESKKISKDIRQIALELDKLELFRREPNATEKILKVLSYADSFDGEYGQRLRNDWQDYKDGGLEREVPFGDFNEKILQLAIDIETYFSSDSLEPDTNNKYIKQSIYDSLDTSNRGFDYKKLRDLLVEIDNNYQSKNVYSCLTLIRAVIDHIPPLLGFKTFKQLTNNYPFSQTDKAYAETLLANKQMLHDVLHRPISQYEDLFEFSDIPEKMYLNRLLQICLEGDIHASQLSRVDVKLSKESKGRQKGTNPPPIVDTTIQSVSSSGQRYTVSLSVMNKGQELAILKSLKITDGHVLDLGTFRTLGPNESAGLKIELYGTEFRNNSRDAKLSVLYSDIYGNDYKSTYNIEKKKRADGLYNFKAISDFNFFKV